MDNSKPKRTRMLRCALLIAVFFHFGFSTASAQKIAGKTNLLYWATTTPNLGAEFGLGRRTTLDLSVGYNPWTLDDSRNRKLKHVMAMPEFRYWLCERFHGHFFGLHAGYVYYNISAIPAPFYTRTRDHRYEGWATAVGLSYGYSWVLGRRWNLEATLGVGYVHADYRKYDCATCGNYFGRQTKNIFYPTKAGITLIYMIK